MVDLFYPYYQKAAIWDELRYSLRSVEKHLKEPFLVFIVGDLPEWCTNVIHIQHKRSEGMKENCTYDAISKLLRYMNDNRSGDSFIRMYDDTYLIGDVSLEEISKVKAMCYYNEIPDEILRKAPVWTGQMKNTINMVRENGYRGINTESHFPEYFIKKMMLQVIHDYKALDNRLLTSTLYHNVCMYMTIFHFFKKDYGIQFYGGEDGLWKSSNEGDIESKCTGKLYLNHNNAGLNENVKQFLMNRFPDKSSFEL